MTITLDNSSIGRQGYGGTITQNHTVGVGTYRKLVWGLGSNVGPDIVSGVTFNGVALSRVRAETNGSGLPATYLYELDSPPVGTYPLVGTFTSGDAAGVALASSWVSDTGAISVSNHNGSTSPLGASPSTISITGTGGVVVGVIANMVANGTSNFSPDVSQTLIASSSNDGGGGAGTAFAQMSYKAGATAMTTTWPSGDRIVGQSALRLTEASGSTTTTITWTEGAEVFTLSGSVTVSGIAVAAAWTEGAETFAAAGTISAAMGTITTRIIKNNTGFARVNLANCAINIYNATTGALVLHLTGLTSNSTGRLVIANAALVYGTSYAYEIDLTAVGFGRRLPLALAA